MAKLVVLIAVVCLAACVQLTYSMPVDDAINNDLRESLKGYYKIQDSVEPAYKDDLQKLITQTEAALKAADHDEKVKLLNEISGLSTSNSDDFNKYLSRKFHELSIDTEINTTINYYKTLLTKADIGAFKPEIEQAIEKLTTILKEEDAAKKLDAYEQFDKDFSGDFKDFLKKQSQPYVEGGLKSTIEFFGKLLAEPEPKFKQEITDLKTQAEAGLSTGLLDEEQRVFYEVSNPKNVELFNYLKERYIETQ